MLSSEPKILGAGPSTGVTPPIPSTGELGFTASAPEIGAGLIPTTTLFGRKNMFEYLTRHNIYYLPFWYLIHLYLRVIKSTLSFSI